MNIFRKTDSININHDTIPKTKFLDDTEKFCIVKHPEPQHSTKSGIHFKFESNLKMKVRLKWVIHVVGLETWIFATRIPFRNLAQLF